MTVPRLRALLRVWDEDPPVQVAFARFVGIKPKGAMRGPEDFIADLAVELSR